MPKANIEERAEDFCFDKHGPLGCSTDKADRPCKECFVKAIAAFSTAGLREQIAEICNAVGVNPEYEVEEAARRQYRRYSLQEINQHQTPSKKANSLTATAPTTCRPYESDATAMSRALNVIDALPAAFRMAEATPLRDALPGIWPTVGDLRACLAAPGPAAGGGREEDDWRDDPSADERWNAGLDFGMEQLCSVLGVDPKAVVWDAATETLDGDVCSVIGNILTAWAGDDWRHAPRSILSAPSEAGGAGGGGWRFDLEAAPVGRDVQVYCEDTEEQFVAFKNNEGEWQYAFVRPSGTRVLCSPSAWRRCFDPPAPLSSTADAGAEGGQA